MYAPSCAVNFDSMSPETRKLFSSDAAVAMCNTFNLYADGMPITSSLTVSPLEKAFNGIKCLFVEENDRVMFDIIMKDFISLMFKNCMKLFPRPNDQNVQVTPEREKFATRLIFFLHDCVVNEVEIIEINLYFFLEFIFRFGQSCSRYEIIFVSYFGKLSDSFQSKVLEMFVKYFDPKSSVMIPRITLRTNGDLEIIKRSVELFTTVFNIIQDHKNAPFHNPFLLMSLYSSDHLEHYIHIFSKLIKSGSINFLILIRDSCRFVSGFEYFVNKIHENRQLFQDMSEKIVSDTIIQEIPEDSLPNLGIILETLLKIDETMINSLAECLSPDNKIKLNSSKMACESLRVSSVGPLLALKTIPSDILSNEEGVLLKLDSDLIAVSSSVRNLQKYYFEESFIGFGEMDKVLLEFFGKDSQSSFSKLSPELSFIRFKCLVKYCDVAFQVLMTNMFTYKYMINLMKYFIFHVHPYHHHHHEGEGGYNLDLEFELNTLRQFMHTFITDDKFWLLTSEFKVIFDFLKLTTLNAPAEIIYILIAVLSNSSCDNLVFNAVLSTSYTLDIFNPILFSASFVAEISKNITAAGDENLSLKEKKEFLSSIINPLFSLLTVENQMLNKTEREIYKSFIESFE